MTLIGYNHSFQPFFKHILFIILEVKEK